MTIARSTPALLPFVLLLATANAARADDGGQKIHRCLGAHGEIVFSGLPCAAGEPTGAAASPTTATTTGADACPASRAELRERIAAAIARNDPNALAGLLRWRGVGASAAASRLRTLRQLAGQPLLALDDGFEGESADTDEAQAAPSGDSLRVRTGDGARGGVHEHRFGIESEGACHWLTW